MTSAPTPVERGEQREEHSDGDRRAVRRGDADLVGLLRAGGRAAPGSARWRPWPAASSRLTISTSTVTTKTHHEGADQRDRQEQRARGRSRPRPGPCAGRSGRRRSRPAAEDVAGSTRRNEHPADGVGLLREPLSRRSPARPAVRRAHRPATRPTPPTGRRRLRGPRSAASPTRRSRDGAFDQCVAAYPAAAETWHRRRAWRRPGSPDDGCDLGVTRRPLPGAGRDRRRADSGT